MKIVIPSIGTRGDVQPYIALAAGLQEAGHHVTLMSHPVMASLAASYGIPFRPMGPDIDLGYETAVIRGKSRNWLLGFLRVMRFSFAMLEQSHHDILEQCRTADLVIVSHSAAGSMEADRLQKPAVSVTLMPQAIPVQDPRRAWHQRAAGAMAGAAMGWMMTRPLNQIRKKFGLPPMGATGITSPHLNLIPLSPLVYPPHPLWEARHRLTGYWFTADPAGWSPPPALLRFLESGEPPAVISLGAMSIGGNDAGEMVQLVLHAVREAGARAILQGWDKAAREAKLPETVLQVGSVPHGWLFERAGWVVHHGGFGTTAAGLRAGIPSIVIPHIIDQFIWGKKVHELGVGPQPISRKDLNPRRLAAALAQAREDDAMRQRAAQLGRQIRAERGVQNAVALIEEIMG